jgi:REP element-mobilizing transposase RayT
MLDHLHLVTNSKRSTGETHRFVNGIISRRILDHLEEAGHRESLEKLRISERSDGWKYSLWDHHPNTRLLWNESMLWERIQYTHLNPVRAELADHPNEWRWSSARLFHGRAWDDEPLSVDLDQIVWTR